MAVSTVNSVYGGLRPGSTPQESTTGGLLGDNYGGSAGMSGLWGGNSFMPTDPRGGNRPTGGSSHAAQYTDKSVIQTGKPGDSIGFGSPKTKRAVTKRYKQDPYYSAHTEEEFAQRKLDQGIAPTHANMGSLAVQYRADADAAHARGELSVADKRAKKVLDERAADDYKFNVIDVRGNQAAQARAKDAAQKAYLNKFSSNTKANMESTKSQLSGRVSRFGSGSKSSLNNNKRSGGSSSTAEKAKTRWKSDDRSINQTGVYGQPYRGIGPGGPTATDMLNSTSDTSQGFGIKEMGLHSQLPYTQTLSTKKKASAGQGAAPGSAGGAMFTMANN